MYLDFFDRKILDILSRKHEPMTLGELVSDLGFARSTVIIHLERLGSEGLVLKEKKPSIKGKHKKSPFFDYAQCAYKIPLRAGFSLENGLSKILRRAKKRLQ